MNVICYKRVSTDDQADRGFSLQHQEKMLTQYCEINKFNIVDIYTEDYSGKTFDRPKWNEIMEYIRKNKGKVDIILCLRWDRFSRNQYDALTTIKTLKKLGVTVRTVEQQLDLNNPDNKILLSMYLTLPEVENDKNSIRTTEGSRRARIEGCWTAQAPKGYVNYRDDKKSTLRPSQDAPKIAEAFKRLSTGAYSADEVRRWLNQNGVKISKQTFLNTIRNPVYTGKIYVKPWKNEPSQIVMGLQPPLITEEIFHLANDVLEGRKRNMKFHDDKSDLYPLKGFLRCPVHNRSLTAYACQSHNKELHHYYFCGINRCKQRHRIKDVHESVEEILSTISFSAQTVNLYKRLLEKIFEKEDLNRRDEIQRVKKDIEKAEARRSNLQDLILDGTISPQDYQDMKGKVDKDLVLFKSKLSGLMDQPSPYKTYISKTVPMLENLTGYYKAADGQTKRKILGCIFSEKLVFEKGRVATTPFTEPIQVLFKIAKVLQGSKNKKEVENNLLSTLAPQVRLELTTHGLTVRCSNQLSY